MITAITPNRLKMGVMVGRTWLQEIEAEEPDEVKVSRPVLKTSRSGDGLA
ncbi:MAG: hypothetical protein GDA56_10160 [Hormoscilla sp. GM7CHS1pb]|nr:hypothetical protein [Hormoscilla sp. GM7CHS1pb]